MLYYNIRADILLMMRFFSLAAQCGRDFLSSGDHRLNLCRHRTHYPIIQCHHDLSLLMEAQVGGTVNAKGLQPTWGITGFGSG